jgi:hypothetical protein
MGESPATISRPVPPHTGIGMAALKPVLWRLRGVWRCRCRKVVTAERHLYGDRDPVLETSKLPNSAGDRRFGSISLQREVRCEPAAHPPKGSRPKPQRASQVSMKTARDFRSLFAAGILKSVMGKDRSRGASPKRLQRLAPPAAAWATFPLPRDKSGRPRRSKNVCRLPARMVWSTE